jgi:hypothetical protein
MSKIAASVVGLLLLLLPAIALAQQQQTELNVGWLNYSAGTINQNLSVRNNGLLPLRTVRIGCSFSHFFKHYSKKLGASTVDIENVASNATGYGTMKLPSKISPTSATCNIVSVKRSSSCLSETGCRARESGCWPRRRLRDVCYLCQTTGQISHSQLNLHVLIWDVLTCPSRGQPATDAEAIFFTIHTRLFAKELSWARMLPWARISIASH